MIGVRGDDQGQKSSQCILSDGAFSLEKRHTIQSVDRALEILELFNVCAREMSLSEIARALQLNKSTAFGLVGTLRDRGYLDQNPENAHYRLGIKLFSLGSLVEANLDVREVASPFLKLLSQKYKETVHLCLYVHREIIYIDKVDGPGSMRMYSQLGRTAPFHCTGVGKVILANLDSRTREQILAAAPLKAYTPNTLTTPEALLVELDRIRAQGYGIDEQEIEIGLRCVAAPIFNRKGEVVAAISVAGPASRIEQAAVADISTDVRKISALISERLGYQPGRA